MTFDLVLRRVENAEVLTQKIVIFLIRLCPLSVGGAPPKKNQSFTDGTCWWRCRTARSLLVATLSLRACVTWCTILWLLHSHVTWWLFVVDTFWKHQAEILVAYTVCNSCQYCLDFIYLLLFLKITINEYKKSHEVKTLYLLIMSGYWSLIMLVLWDLTSSLN